MLTLLTIIGTGAAFSLAALLRAGTSGTSLDGLTDI